MSRATNRNGSQSFSLTIDKKGVYWVYPNSYARSVPAIDISLPQCLRPAAFWRSAVFICGQQDPKTQITRPRPLRAEASRSAAFCVPAI